MKMSRALLALTALAAYVSSAQAWWRDDGFTSRSSTTTTIVVRPYNAFSDLSGNIFCNGAMPLSLLSQCMNGGCCNAGGGAAYQRPACNCAGPYVPYPQMGYYPAAYYPQAAYYPPPPPPGYRGAPPMPYPPPGPPPYPPPYYGQR